MKTDIEKFLKTKEDQLIHENIEFLTNLIYEYNNQLKSTLSDMKCPNCKSPIDNIEQKGNHCYCHSCDWEWNW